MMKVKGERVEEQWPAKKIVVTDLADLLQKPIDWAVVNDVHRSGFREGWIDCLESLQNLISLDVYHAAWDFWAEELRLWMFEGKGFPPDFHYTAPKKPRPALSARVRFAILKRDGYRCQLCGVAATDGPDVRLQVDHKYAWSKGGSSAPTNLWTLCQTCNGGKGTQELGPMRPLAPSNVFPLPSQMPQEDSNPMPYQVMQLLKQRGPLRRAQIRIALALSSKTASSTLNQTLHRLQQAKRIRKLPRGAYEICTTEEFQ